MTATRERATGASLRIRVPATTANLGPGFDALGLALSLYNEVEVRVGSLATAEPARVPVTVRGEGEGSLATDETNLVAQVFLDYFDRRGLPCPAVALACTNRIPLARGLGSSAAAIVSALVAADRVASMQGAQPLAPTKLLSLAVEWERHPDNVAAALFGGLVVVAGQEGPAGGWRWLRLDPPIDLQVVVAVPSYEVSTARARAALPSNVPYWDAVFNVNRVALLVAAFASGDLASLATAMDDRLHQPYRAQLVPGFEQAVAAAREAGALGVALSGSGPTVIAFLRRTADSRAVAAALQRSLATRGAAAHVLEVTPEQTGCTVLEQP